MKDDGIIRIELDLPVMVNPTRTKATRDGRR
jgi:hypothetical protein